MQRGGIHVEIVRAEDDDVVRVMRDGGGQRAAPQSEAADEAETDVARRVVPLDDGQLEDVPRGVGFDEVVDHQGILHGGDRDDLPRHEFDHLDTAVRHDRDEEAVLPELAHVHGTSHVREIRRRRCVHDAAAVARGGRAAVPDLLGADVLQIGEKDQIRPVSGRDGAVFLHAVMPRGVDSGDLQRGHGIQTETDGFPHVMVDVSLVLEVGGMLVVGGETELHRVLGCHEREQVVQVAFGRALAHEDLHAAAEFLLRLLARGAFVIAAHAGEDVGVELGTGQSRRVAVDPLAARRVDFRKLGLHAAVHSGEVHQFGHAEHILLAGVQDDVHRREPGARRLQRGCRDAGRHHHEDVERQVFRCLEHVVDAVESHDVRELMRIDHHGGGAARHHGAGEFRDREHGAFDVDVGVNEGRGEIASAAVDDRPALVRPDADDHAVRHRDVAFMDLAAQHVHDPRVAEHDVGGLVPPRRCQFLPDVVHVGFSCGIQDYVVFFVYESKGGEAVGRRQ